MQTRNLGNQGLRVPAVGLGCMGMSTAYGERDDESSTRAIHRAIERGAGFLDTSDAYGNGVNEELVGKAIKGKRDQVILASKFGNIRLPDGGREIVGRPDYVPQACDASLKRLGVDHIDLYYQHRVDPTVPIEETVGAMSDLVKAGKVRYLGLSEASSEDLQKASRETTITALQTEYSMWSRDVEEDILATCRELDIAFVPYSPLGRGFLTGAIPSRDLLEDGDFRLHGPRFQEDALAKNKVFLQLIENIAKQKGITAAQVALAWVLNQGDDMFPIPGTRKVSRLKENLAALDVNFSEAELADIRAKLPTAEGGRY